MSIDSILAEFIQDEQARGTITHVQAIPARAAQYADWPGALDPRLKAALETRGIGRLFTHQAEAVAHVAAHRNVVVVTPTASGKTLCYNLPVLQSILQDPAARALYLFPTKALAQDQVAELQEVIDVLKEPIRTFPYDGDTPDDARRAIRAQGHIVVTNPDMLHQGILPHHAKWAKLFENLRVVVLDEMHTYRGVFGSHLCNVLRRLRRVCRFYRSDPVFVFCSATLANPKDLAERLLEQPVELVDRNGAPSGEKVFVFYNPPVVNRDLGIRQSCLKASRDVAARFLDGGVKTLVFATSRLNVEVLTRDLKERFERRPPDEGRIRGYRGGYLPTVRREIEKGLRAGDIQGVISTNALELGIDVGHLDAAVMAGYPGSIASTWQQAGRAGRRAGKSAAVLVARSEPLDQFLVNSPEYFFGQSPEHALINPDNLLILVGHLKCAAFEMPIDDGEKFGGENLPEILDYLQEHGVLNHREGKWYWTQEVYPADSVSLRSVSNENFVILDESQQARVLAEVDYTAAPSTVYEEAIYLCEAKSYQVTKLDYAQRRAYVKPVDVEYFTEAMTNTSVRVIDIFEGKPVVRARKEQGEVHVAWRVSGFKKIKFATRENVGYGEVHLQDQEMQTTATWLMLPAALVAQLPFSRAEILDGVMGLAYLMHRVAPIFLLCDRKDIGMSVGDKSAQWSARTMHDVKGRFAGNSAVGTDGKPKDIEALGVFEPTIYVYDSYPGGVGLSPSLYDLKEKVLEQCYTLLAACECAGGCPTCVGPANEVGRRSKEVARVLLSALVYPETGSQRAPP